MLEVGNIKCIVCNEIVYDTIDTNGLLEHQAEEHPDTQQGKNARLLLDSIERDIYVPMKPTTEYTLTEEHSKILSEFQSAFSNLGKALGRYYNKEYGMTKHFLNHVDVRINEIISELTGDVENE